ncbi:MAG: hypothetical protein JWP88_1907 [Flaviaesturariibacter sp.]|nr:hypothetical protein [Flaviaesturariibacter sp.]
MNSNRKWSLRSIGYDFIDQQYLPAGKDEYHLRNIQNRNGTDHRNLSAYEIEVLVRNNNTSDNWNNIQVSNAFNPELVKNCKFYGLVRMGKLEPIAIQYHNVCLPVGLYNSTIISCDFGDNVVVNNVNYISHYIIGNEVMLVNIHELHTTDHAKFGNGILKEGEEESVRVWLEVCNENAGRKILPFNGMQPGDAYLWSKYRGDKLLMERFKELTEKRFDKQRGYYGKIGDHCVIKNTSIIKDVWIGCHAYIKGANKLKNLTINSSEEATSQIGEGCELVNGVVGFGCRIFYGAKAVRFVMASHSQLKYGARLINSYLGNNATISCCEVLNSLIFPAHEQHHNNSFLCASLVMGQSNIAAGATIGSNHNSRAADGEIIAGRGFWPGLCVSLKHNSKFATFNLIAKGDYTCELNIPFPFALVSNDDANNRLVIMPAYWFQYNMYALARNAYKYVDRDKRTDKIQHIEYDYLAPDSINEIFTALRLLQKFTASSIQFNYSKAESEESLVAAGKLILEDPNTNIKGIEIRAWGIENNTRPTVITKVLEAYRIYKELIVYYAANEMIKFIAENDIGTFEELVSFLPESISRLEWQNVGGQLLPKPAVQNLINNIKEKIIDNWDAVHHLYKTNGYAYQEQKLQHAFASVLELLGLTPADLKVDLFKSWLNQAIKTREWMTNNIYHSRAKDYTNEFRKMPYDTIEEMDEVVGKLEDNIFIQQQAEELIHFKEKIAGIIHTF